MSLVKPEDVRQDLVDALTAAVEGECDGFAITERQARMILGCVLSAQQDAPTDSRDVFERIVQHFLPAGRKADFLMGIRNETGYRVVADYTPALEAAYAEWCRYAPAQDAEREDTERMDYLESLRQRAIAKGFQWNNWHFDAKQSDLTIRKQVDAARAQRAAAQGDAR